MKRTISTLVGLTTVFLAVSARAEVRCTEGRTRSGECINPLLASVMRHSAIVRVQPKISFNAPLNLPSEDSFYPPARDHHDERAMFGTAERAGIPRP